MRCGQCNVTYCEHRLTDGECFYEIHNHKSLEQAASELVDAIEKYIVQQEFRQVLVSKKNELKEILKCYGK